MAVRKRYKYSPFTDLGNSRNDEKARSYDAGGATRNDDGIVPHQQLGTGGTGAGTKYLKDDGTYGTPSGSGDVVGPASATDNAIARFDSTTGKLVQDSVVTVSDAGAITVPEIAAPSTPAAGKVVVYAKSDGKLYIKDDAGAETDLTGGGGGVSDGDKGDITVSGSGATWTIDAQAVGVSKMTVSATSRILGRTTAGAGAAEELTGDQARAITGAGKITHGTYAGAPGSPSDGDVHFVTGTPYYLSRESGAWVARTRSHGVALTLPGQNSMAAASWTAITGASAGVVAITDYEQGLDLEVTTPGGTSTDTFPFDLAMSPAWASWTSLTIAMESSDQYQNFTKAAACLRESTTGKLLWWGRHSNTGVKLMSQRQIGPGAAISNSVNDTSGGEVGLRWFRMTKNGTNIEFYHSIDGVGWDSYGNIATATAFTTNPDRIALLIMSNVASRTFRMRVWHVAQV
jgi:hypothetical protein